MNHIPKVYFINLDHRRDRHDEFMNWIQGSGFPLEKVERIQAVYTQEAGIFGCLASHIKSLQTFLASDHNICMICEDDFMPLDIITFWDNYERLFKDSVDFDVVMASYNVLQHTEGPQPYLKKMLYSLSASSYLITREFAPKLLAVWTGALQKIVESLPCPTLQLEPYFNDVVWMPLMKESKWYCFYPRIGKQRDSFSDIQGHYTTYEC
jgi:hypothetical protein